LSLQEERIFTSQSLTLFNQTGSVDEAQLPFESIILKLKEKSFAAE
jgi:hypothetical protein